MGLTLHKRKPDDRPDAYSSDGIVDYLLARGGLAISRKSLYNGLRLYGDLHPAPSCTPDLDYFGQRSTMQAAAVMDALQEDLVREIVYVNRNARKREPPHRAYILTSRGAARARDRHTAESLQRDRGSFAEMVAYAWLPPSAAMQYALGQQKDCPFPQGSTFDPVSAPYVITPDALDRTTKAIERRMTMPDSRKPVLSHFVARKKGAEVSIEYSINPECIGPKYEYLEASPEDLDRFNTCLDETPEDRPWSNEYQQFGIDNNMFPDIAYQGPFLRQLQEDEPRILQGWKERAGHMLAECHKGEKSLKRRIDDARTIAKMTGADPVRTRVRIQRDSTLMTTDWPAIQDESTALFRERYGIAGVRAFIEDPMEFLSYLIVATYKQEQEVIERTLPF